MKILEKIRRSGFRGKLFFIFASSAALSISFSTLFWISYTGETVRKSVERDLQIIASRTSGELNQYFSGKTDTIRAVRELLSYPGEDRFKLELMLKRISLEFIHFKKLSLFDTSNKLIAASSVDENASLSADVLSTVKKGRTYRSPMLFTKDNLPYIKIVVPLFWQGEAFRFLEADIDIMAVWTRIDDIKIGETGRASILSEEGVFLADIDRERVLRRETWRNFVMPNVSLTGNRGVLEIKDRTGRSLYVAYAEMPSVGWKVVLMQDESEAMHFLWVMVYRSLFIMAVIGIALYYVASWLSQRISRPVEELYKGTEELVKGNLEYKVPELAGNEFSALGKAFNAMILSVAEKERIEKELANAERLAAVGRLAQDMAHEVNNPLAIMKNYIYVMSKKKISGDDPNQKYLNIIDGEIDRIARIIRQFNDFYKGKHTAVVEDVNILAPIKEVLDFCRIDLEGKGIAVEERLTDEGKVAGDSDKLKQVFLNLIKNAGDSMTAGGRLTVETKKADEEISVLVKDTGMGINKSDIKKIFDPFFSTKGIKGTGLGLSVSYGIIKGFNGDIEVESEVGKGTTFKVTLPLTAS